MTIAKWQYREESLPHDPDARHAILESLGHLGWELASVDEGIAFFKRPLLENPDFDKLHVRLMEASGIRGTGRSRGDDERI